MQFDALSWNVFHGRDHPPDGALFTRRSWLFGTEERNATHLQVNRSLYREFAGLLAASRWDVALLQEFPPRWAHRMAGACGADMQLTLTSRNWMHSVRRPIASRRPDLMGAWEGGANVILARGALRSRLGATEVVLRGRPERRMVTLARLERTRTVSGEETSPGRPSGTGAAGFESGLVVANLHASGPSPLAAEDTRMAAEAAVNWAGDDPLILGGDLNVSPGETGVFDELERRFGLGPPTGPRSIDHLLARGLEVVEPPSARPPESREVTSDGLAIRLSDHPPVHARFALPSAGSDAAGSR
jgi:endonuclease/exonuclease/phosphatase family metal-dependent hydrolase